jgi:hypothetical protein
VQLAAAGTYASGCTAAGGCSALERLVLRVVLHAYGSGGGEAQ